MFRQSLLLCAFCISIPFAVALLLAGGCAGGRQSSVPPGRVNVSGQVSDTWGPSSSSSGESSEVVGATGLETDSPLDASLDEALAELAEMKTPEGVEEELFEELKDALSGALLRRLRGRAIRELPLQETETAGDKSPPYRILSLAPIGPKNLIEDLSYSVDGEGVFTLTWSYRNCGDYNQDGIVNISDITPLAVHFNEFIDPESGLWEHPVDEVIDGNGDGAINIMDITPLAAYFFVNIDHYLLMAADSEEGPFEEAGQTPLGTLEETPAGRRQVAGDLGDSLAHFFWCLLPVDFEDNEGDASNVVQIVVSPPEIESISPRSGHSGDELEIHAVVSGTPPKSFTWDFGGGAEPNITAERTPTVTLGAEGRYTASLSVTSPYGEDSASFTLTVGPAGDWMFYLVDEGSQFELPSLAVIDGRPAIGYNDQGQPGSTCVWFKYAINSEPDGSGEWLMSEAAPPYDTGHTFNGMAPRLVEYGGGPAFLYHVWQPGELRLAVNASPDGTEAWESFRVAEENTVAGMEAGLAVAADRLAVSHWVFHGSPAGIGNDIRLALSGPLGAVDLWTISDIHAEPDEARMSHGRHSSLAVIGGRLGVAYFSYPIDEWSSAGQLRFAINDELDGSGEWKRYLIERSDGGVLTGRHPSLAEVDGRPAIAYARQDWSEDISSLKFAVNTKTDGSGYWNRFTLDSGNHWVEHPSLAVVGGRPAIAYDRWSRQHGVDGMLVYGECTQADGTGIWSWEVLDPRPGAGLYPSLATLTDGRPAIAYYDGTNQRLMLAVRDY